MDKPDVDPAAVAWLTKLLSDLTDPVGTDIPLPEGRHAWAGKGPLASFLDEATKKTFVDLARSFRWCERENFRLKAEGRAAEWSPVSSPPPHRSISAKRYHLCLATSPALAYVVLNGVVFARYQGGLTEVDGTWEVLVNGVWIEHTPSHWRDIPPGPERELNYESVREQAESICKQARLTPQEPRAAESDPLPGVSGRPTRLPACLAVGTAFGTLGSLYLFPELSKTQITGLCLLVLAGFYLWLAAYEYRRDHVKLKTHKERADGHR